jgi:probable F420-dependent oxidoreductase
VTRPFRFAVQSYSAASAQDWRDQARRAEALGYSTFHTADHHIGPGPALDPTNHGVQDFAAIPAIAAAAAATTTINVGCRVFCTDYRNPVVFAKELATLDVLSEGRLEIGLGCGWLGNEYDAIGIPFDRPGVRIDRMVETLGVIRAHFAEGEMNVEGEHVHAVGFEGVPKPIRAGGPPIMIGGGSERVLGIAGREADIVSLNFDNSSGSLGASSVVSGTGRQTEEKLRWIRAGAGARFDTLELEIAAYFTVITDDVDAARSALASRFDTDPAVLADHPHALIGSVEQICDLLIERRERFGISYVTLGNRAFEAFAPVVERLAGR